MSDVFGSSRLCSQFATAMARARDALATRTDSRVLAVSFHDPTLVRLEPRVEALPCSNRARGFREITDLSSICAEYRKYRACTKVASEPLNRRLLHLIRGLISS